MVPQPLRTAALAAVLAAALLSGCGSDDDTGGSASDTATNSASPAKSKSESKSKSKAKLKPTSARAKLVKCIEDAGFEVTYPKQDAATATNYTVKGDKPGVTTALIVIHPNRDDAASAARRAGVDKGINAVAFGRAEFIPRAAGNTETGVLANCIAAQYAR
jgi:hypothetical protein